MQEVMQFATQAGFSPPTLELDGNVHRFDRRGKNNAWYVGWQHFGVKSGEPYYVCVFGDWKHQDKAVYKPTKKLARDDHEIVKKRMADAIKKSEDEKESRHEDASKKALSIIKNMRQDLTSDYFFRKKITELHGAGTIVNAQCDRVIVVPMRDIDGKIWGAQRIFPDGTKRFLTGQKTGGCFHVIGDENGDTAYLCEGFATGASIRQATGATVFVCFNASNLVGVAKAVRKRWPDKSLTICGDDDKTNEKNIGREKAEEAALACVGRSVFPACSGTDFNDMHLEVGLEAVRSTIAPADDAPDVGYAPLGFEERTHYFFSNRSKSIKKITAFTNTDFYELMPKEYWVCAYGNEKGAINWDNAKSDLVARSNEIGIYDHFKIRGTGVWWDNGRVVYNNGERLVIDGRIEKLTASGVYRYITTVHRTPDLPAPLSVAECRVILDACSYFKWKEDKSWMLLAGHLAIARIAGALTIRPHCWITGGSHTGKSFLFQNVITPCLGDSKGWLQAQGSTTEAGLRQTIGCSTIPVIFDEFESDGGFSVERVNQTIELFRSSWSANDAVIIKGSASGASSQYQLAFPAIVASVRVSNMSDADKSRFSILELAPHENDMVHFAELSRRTGALNATVGDRLFSRAYGMVKTIRASQEVFSKVLAGIVNQRYGQQAGTALAGYYSLISDQVVTKETAASIVADMCLRAEKEEAADTDEIECENHLLTWKLSLRGAGGGPSTDLTVGEAIRLVGSRDQLRTYGIRVEGDHYLVANRHAELTKIFSSTRWAGAWSRSLARRPGAVRLENRSFAGTVARAIRLPLYSHGEA